MAAAGRAARFAATEAAGRSSIISCACLAEITTPIPAEHPEDDGRDTARNHWASRNTAMANWISPARNTATPRAAAAG